jgi:hypothetical protein
MNLAHTAPSDSSPCLNVSSWMRSGITLVIGKKNKQNSSFSSIQSPPTLPAFRLYQTFASPVRENGNSFHCRVFWLTSGMVRREQFSSNSYRWA